MNSSLKFLLIVIGIVLAIALFPLGISLVWGWVVPDVFAGAVEHGVLPAAISYSQSWKLFLLLLALGVTSHSGGSSKRQ